MKSKCFNESSDETGVFLTRVFEMNHEESVFLVIEEVYSSETTYRVERREAYMLNLEQYEAIAKEENPNTFEIDLDVYFQMKLFTLKMLNYYFQK